MSEIIALAGELAGELASELAGGLFGDLAGDLAGGCCHVGEKIRRKEDQHRFQETIKAIYLKKLPFIP